MKRSLGSGEDVEWDRAIIGVKRDGGYETFWPGNLRLLGDHGLLEFLRGIQKFDKVLEWDEVSLGSRRVGWSGTSVVFIGATRGILGVLRRL